ncbi:MAG: hypothetical protein IPM29_19530 [Planctomycetes bacterium]|nr:hypothetical protein [Planctomycetota bacterium]
MVRAATFLLCLLPACSFGAGPPAPSWERVVLFDGDAKIGGCAVGELDPAARGREVAAVDAHGGVHVVALSADGTAVHHRVAALTGEGIQVAIGEADLDAPGEEIVVVGILEGTEDAGGPGAAHLVRRDGDGWVAERIFQDAALLHAVAIVDGEVFVGGFTDRLFRLMHTPDGWRSQEVAKLPGPAKNAIAARGGIVVACADGSLVLVVRDGAAFTSEVIHKRGVGRARLASFGDELLCADDDGSLLLLHADGMTELLHREREKLRGAVLADLDPAVPGPEAVTAGYGRKVWELARGANGWDERAISEERERVHHVACGDLDGAPGLEIVTAGFAGELVMFRMR